MKRREFITLLGGAAATWPLAARAQQPAVPLVGVVLSGTPAAEMPLLDAFKRGLAQAGYVEGQTVALEYRSQVVRLNDYLLSPTLWPEVPHPVHGDATDAGQLNFRFAALAKAIIESISRLICASKAAGVIGIGSMPCCASFARTPGAASAFCVSWASLSTISRGVLAGTNSPVQNV